MDEAVGRQSGCDSIGPATATGLIRGGVGAERAIKTRSGWEYLWAIACPTQKPIVNCQIRQLAKEEQLALMRLTCAGHNRPVGEPLNAPRLHGKCCCKKGRGLQEVPTLGDVPRSAAKISAPDHDQCSVVGITLPPTV